MRWPSSPGQGAESRPGSSFWNLTHITLRPLVLVDGVAGADECPQESAMLQIVVDLRGREHRELRIDREDEARVRSRERLADLAGARRAREEEAEIARALG